jgi:hypothetical protein
MQFIEKNSFNVRSAVYRLKKDGAGLEFLLFPMIHVGSKEFYEDVSRRSEAHAQYHPLFARQVELQGGEG